jgi:hypothetical protein
MKKILAGIMGLLMLASLAMATAPAAPTLYNQLYWDQAIGNNIYLTGNTEDYNKSGTHGRDSLKGADTIILVNNYPIESEYEYIAQLYDSAGAADSSILYCQIVSMDKKYSQGWTILDSAHFTHGTTMNTMVANAIPTSSVGYGGFINVRIIKYTATLITKVFRFELIRRSPVKKGMFGY